MSASDLVFGVLGPLEVRRAGVPIELGPPKQRAVLGALLLARGRVVSVDRLLEAAWGEDVPPSGVQSLQVYVSNLRRLLRDGNAGADPITRRAPGYVVELPTGALDADLFTSYAEQARTAADRRDWASALDQAALAQEVWRGEVLADQPDAAWLTAEREAQRERHVEVGALAVAALSGLGRGEEAVEVARRLARDEPYRDDVARLELLALHRAGRTAQALDAHARHVARLDDELGLEPSAALREAQVAVLRQEPWTLSWPDPVGSVPAQRVAEVPVERERRGFVGRRAQLDTAGALVDGVVRGRARSLVLTGPAGIGKTRLAEEVLSLVAGAGGRPLRTRSIEEPGAPAWWPLRQLVRDLGEDPDEVLVAPAGADADTLRFAVYERLRGLLVRAAQDQPVAVLVDDLQWVDPASSACLAYLATALAASPVLLVATVRDGEGGAELRRTIAGLLRAEGAVQLVVPPLAVEEVADLAGHIAGESFGDDESRSLARRTGGNALFVCEYARLPADDRARGEIPLAVRGVLGRRVERLDDEVRQLLQLAAAAGDVLEPTLLARVAELGDEQLLDLLDAAGDAHIVEPVPGGAGYQFSHALLRDEVLAGVSPVHRQRLHARLAEGLVTAGRERLTARAQHLVAAGSLVDARELVEACRAAALQAEERMSSETAVGWWERAAEALDRLPEDERDPQERDDLVVARVQALVRAGRGQTVLDVVDEQLLDAVRSRRTTTAGRLAATLLRSAGTWPWVTFGVDPGTVLDRLRTIEPFVAEDAAAHARVLAASAVGSCYDLDPRVCDDLSRRAIEIAEATGDPDVLADALLGRLLTYVGVAARAEECEELIARLLLLPRIDPGPDLAVAHSAMTMSRMALGDVRGVEEHLRLGIANSDLFRLPVVRAQLRWMEVGVAHWHHGPDAAFALHAQASAAHRSTELYEGGFTNFNYLALRWDAGTLGEVEEYEGFEDLSWRAAIAAARGERDEALALVRERLVAPLPLAWSTLSHMVVLAHVVADLEDRELAAWFRDWLAPYAGLLTSFGQGPVAGPVDLARARVLLLLGDADGAREAATAAREVSARNQAPRWTARAEALL